jgi:hypothetical protein
MDKNEKYEMIYSIFIIALSCYLSVKYSLMWLMLLFLL